MNWFFRDKSTGTYFWKKAKPIKPVVQLEINAGDKFFFMKNGERPNPWPELNDKITCTVRDCKDGLVRYYQGDGDYPEYDDVKTIESFLAVFKHKFPPSGGHAAQS